MDINLGAIIIKPDIARDINLVIIIGEKILNCVHFQINYCFILINIQYFKFFKIMKQNFLETQFI